MPRRWEHGNGTSPTTLPSGLKKQNECSAAHQVIRKELLSRYFKDVTHPDDFQGESSQCQRLIRGEIKSFDLEKRYIQKNGKTIWVYLNCSVVEDNEGKPVHFLTYIRDITDRRLAEG